MKKNIFLSAIVALVIGSAMTACSDFLEAENKTAGGKTADDYFGNDASSLLVTTYNSLKSIAYNPSLFCEGTDLYINTRGKSTGVFNEYSLSAGDGTVSSFYSNTYKTINYDLIFGTLPPGSYEYIVSASAESGLFTLSDEIVIQEPFTVVQ